MKLLTKKEVCEQLQISQTTIDIIVRKGLLVCYKVGGQCRYTQEDVDSYVRQSKVPFVQPAPRANYSQTRRQKHCTYYPGMKVV